MRRLRGFAMAALLLGQPAMAADISLAVATAEVGYDPFTAQPSVEVVLTQEGRKAFAKLTLQHVGDIIELRVDGELLSAPVVRSPILDGVVVVTGSMTEAEARSLALRLADQTAVITLTPLEP